MSIIKVNDIKLIDGSTSIDANWEQETIACYCETSPSLAFSITTKIKCILGIELEGSLTTGTLSEGTILLECHPRP